MTENISRENSTILKGLSMLCIMSGHFLGGWTRYISPIAGIGVALFLICSGYGLAKSYQKNGLQDFWKKRFWAVFLPYAIFEIVRLAVGYQAYQSFYQFLEDVTLIRPMFGYGWYLNYLLIWYLIFYFSHLIIKDEKLRDVVLVILAIILLFYHLAGDQGLKIEQAFTFVLGVFLAKYDFSKLYNKKIIVECIVIATIALAVKQVPSVRNSPGQVMRWMDLITKSFMGVGLVAGVGKFNIHENIKFILYKVGIISYELYLIHGIIVDIVHSYIKNPMGIVPFFITSIVIASIYHVFLEMLRKKCMRKELSSI